ncbi:hypothetical protein [Myroides odoratus]|uniref:hypothetical protein n=1 Tax=Myroides odoratus TaxID=256 RepID=UPI0039AF6594
MKHLILIPFLFLIYSNNSQAQILTDWQTENSKGKVKQITSIDLPNDEGEVKKQVVHFDARGFFTFKESYSGTRNPEDSTAVLYTKIGELQFFEYQNKQRHGMSVNAEGKKATEFVQQWKGANACQFTYTYFATPEREGIMNLTFSNQAKLEEMHLMIIDKEDRHIQFETKSIHQYDSKGYEIQFQQTTIDPIGDTRVLRIRNTAFDAQGNITEKEVYDENNKLFAKTRFEYEYYE